jgi:hypothetical protein
MGSGSSQPEGGETFPRDEVKFVVARLIQSRPTPIPLTPAIVRQEKDASRFALLSKSDRKPSEPRIWLSKHIFVCAQTVNALPCEQHHYCVDQWGNERYLAISLDPSSYYYMLYFMDNVRFFLHRTEFLQTLLRCIENWDGSVDFQESIPPPITLSFGDLRTIEERHISDIPECGVVVHIPPRPFASLTDADQSMESMLLTSPSHTVSADFTATVSEPSTEFDSNASNTFPFSVSEPISDRSSSSFFDIVSLPSQEFESARSDIFMTASGVSGEDAKTVESSTSGWHSLASTVFDVSDVTGSSGSSVITDISDVTLTAQSSGSAKSGRSGRSSGSMSAASQESAAESSVFTVSGTGTESSGTVLRRRRQPP